ncbi:glycosyltransferase [bacterium]|nr:glycosyltransferase [bacterium]
MPLTPLLFLSPRVPWPADTGAKIRTNALLTALAGHFAIHYVGFLQPGLSRAKARQYLHEETPLLLKREPSTTLVGKAWLGLRTLPGPGPVTLMKYWNSSISTFVAQWDRENPRGVIHADHLHMGQYLPFACRALRVMDEHNVESRILERLADHNQGRPWGPYLNLQARRMARREAQLAGEVDMVLAVSDGDAGDLSAMAPKTRVEVIPNGVDLEYFAPPRVSRPNLNKLVFTGSMDWLPNSDAMIWFVAEILPRLDLRPPRDGPWKLDIVGQNPPTAVRALESARVRVTGPVEDVRPFVNEAGIFVAPIRIGGGSRLKLLEAFSAGIAVVSTKIGCEGLEVENEKHLLIADEPEAFADAVDRLARQPRLRQELTANARRLVEDRYGWGAIGERLAGLYEAELERRLSAQADPVSG